MSTRQVIQLLAMWSRIETNLNLVAPTKLINAFLLLYNLQQSVVNLIRALSLLELITSLHTTFDSGASWCPVSHARIRSNRLIQNMWTDVGHKWRDFEIYLNMYTMQREQPTYHKTTAERRGCHPSTKTDVYVCVPTWPAHLDPYWSGQVSRQWGGTLAMTSCRGVRLSDELRDDRYEIAAVVYTGVHKYELDTKGSPPVEQLNCYRGDIIVTSFVKFQMLLSTGWPRVAIWGPCIAVDHDGIIRITIKQIRQMASARSWKSFIEYGLGAQYPFQAVEA